MKKTKFAIGCLVQWYEIEILSEYIDTLKASVDEYDHDKVLIDIKLCINQDLERLDNEDRLGYILFTFQKLIDTLDKYKVNAVVEKELVTIADYRREFNSLYCTRADVLVWGETDMLVPLQSFTVLDLLHQEVPTTKYVATFGICKMWDESWKILEHPKFTDKPFIENDYDNWWSVKYTMTAEEMNEINNETEELQLQAYQQYKFNGCGLVISSEVVKSGVNIPPSVFFVHEDTAFMHVLSKLLPDTPQYIVRNILVVHNRNHPLKRQYVKDETGDTMNQKRRSNEWYVKANKYSEENCYNLFNPIHKSKTWKDVWE